jgi:hypothetical protein
VAFRVAVGSAPVLMAMLLFPSGLDRVSALGLVVMAIACFWFGTVWRASIASLVDAAAALRATPLTLPDFARAGLRYPVWIATLGAGWLVLGLRLQSAGWALIGLVVVALGAYCALAYTLTLRLRHEPARLPMRIAVESAMAIMLFQAIGPFVLIVVAIQSARHYSFAKKLA